MWYFYLCGEGGPELRRVQGNRIFFQFSLSMRRILDKVRTWAMTNRDYSTRLDLEELTDR